MYDTINTLISWLVQHPVVIGLVIAFCLYAVVVEIISRRVKNRYREFLGPDGSVDDSIRDRFEHPENYRDLPESEKLRKFRQHYESFKERNPAEHARQMRDFETRQQATKKSSEAANKFSEEIKQYSVNPKNRILFCF
jgi:hypothetical protein